MKLTKKVILVFILSFLFIAIFTKTSVDSGNDASRIATIESLVEKGNFIIDDSALNVSDHNKFNDKIFVNGHFYSSKPPVLSFISTPVYFILYNLGIEFKDFHQPSIAYYLQTLFTLGIYYALLNVFFYLFLIKSKLNEKDAVILTIALALGTLMFVYSTVFNNHLPSTAMLFVCFYLIHFIDTFKNKKLALFAAGLTGGLAACFEPPLIMVISLFSLLLIRKERNIEKFSLALVVFWLMFFLSGKNLIISGIIMIIIIIAFFKQIINLVFKNYFFFFGLILPILLYAFLNMQIIGSPIPQHLHPNNREFYNYEGAPWPEGDSSAEIPALEFLFHSTFGYRGLISYSPILLFSLIGISYALKNKNTKLTAIIILFSIIVIYGYYTITDNNYGGYSYGNRRIIVLTPFILLFAKDLFPLKNLKLRYAFYAILLISIVFALIGVYQPWADCWGYEMFFYQPIPLLNNLKNFLQEFILR